MLNADDRHQITQTLALHAYISDEDQLDRLDELFVPDAVYDMSRLGMGAFEGMDAIRSAASGLRASGHAPTAHFVTNVVIDERDGGTAGARSRGLMIMHDGELRAVTYDDTLRRHDGRWLISLRMITPLHPSSDV
jgi:3-phenylpropionate/cinnamic acid dioxygenase small subunit